jgi:hypothetical protein
VTPDGAKVWHFWENNWSWATFFTAVNRPRIWQLF